MFSELVTFDDFTNLNITELTSLNAHKDGFLVGVYLQKLQGQKHALDVLTWTLSIYASQAGFIDADYLIWRTTMVTPQYDLPIPLLLDKTQVNAFYHTYFGQSGIFANVPFISLIAQLSVAGMNNIPVASYRYRIRIDTAPLMSGD